ncbi:hypothetical protein EMCRGX_G018701 [Ephydatia muelleri]
MYLSETVQVTSLDVTQVTLFNSSSVSGDSRQLTGGYTQSSVGTVIAFVLNSNDLNYVKMNDWFATSKNNTYLTLTNATLQDMASNPVQENTTQVLVSQFYLDTSSPLLDAFTFDANLGILSLTFSETAYRRQAHRWYLSQWTHRELAAHYCRSECIDRPAKHRKGDIASTYLRVDTTAVADMRGNLVQAIPPSLAIRASGYNPDTVPPTLVGFVLNLNTSLLVLTFSKTIDVSSVLVSTITLLSSPLPNASYVQLTVGRVQPANSISVTVSLSTQDTNTIKRTADLATSLNNTFLSITNRTATDIAGNAVLPALLQASSFVPDRVVPRVLSFNFDLNTGTFTFSFDETINSSSFDPARVTIQGAQNWFPGTTFYVLTGGYIATGNSDVLVLVLTLNDLNNVKAIPLLAKNANTTFVSLTAYTVADMAGNMVVPISNGSALQGTFQPDTTIPSLLYFGLDMNTGRLLLQFSETVNYSTLVGRNLAFGSAPGIISTYLSSTAVSTNYSADIIVYLSPSDQDTIKRNRMYATSLTNTALTVLTGSVQDTAVPPNYVLYSSMYAANFTPDTTPPNLLSWGVDISTSVLYMYFDEGCQQQLPAGGGTNSGNERSIVVSMTEWDLNAIKALSRLLKSINSSYMSINFTFIQDMNANFINAIPPTSALQATMYQNNTVLPRLRSFALDMNIGVITFSFSETVVASTFVVQGVSLQADFSTPDPDNRYTLTQGVVLLSNGPNVSVAPYWNVEGNPLLAVEDSVSAIRASSYISDQSGPALMYYDLNMASGALSLFFNETVYTGSINVTQLTFCPSANCSGVFQYTLTLSSTVANVGVNYENVTIVLGLGDLNAIKQHPELATSANSTYLWLTSAALVDMAGNRVQPIVSQQALKVRSFTSDVVNPVLMGFDLNLTLNTLTLYFSETVNASSLNVGGITLQAAYTSTGAFYTLTAGGTQSQDGPVIIILLNTNDVNRIKQFITLATSKATTHLSVTNTTISDMSKNPLIPILPIAALQVNVYTADIVPPQLVSFSLDLNSATLTLSFSETVNSLTLIVTQITLQDAQWSTSRRQIFDAIKKNTNITTSLNNTYISITAHLVNDMSGNRVVPVTIQASNFTGDVTPPWLVAWTLDMNTGYITITFSETVNAYSFNPQAITIQTSSSILSTPYKVLTGGNSTADNSTVIGMVHTHELLCESK